ncbi:39 kDa FK506-binding nuclear protein-like [Contarinia nasturtii]|uniref:39 kDa FK506-binding nuclear protein-like n=1 Tax=Contarinia nasturtii TaxID=265458 RepID=UPI0012D44B3A|nr:39 kDa FK506-binding nuclear protein-like [Contarinia nasturtii]
MKLSAKKCHTVAPLMHDLHISQVILDVTSVPVTSVEGFRQLWLKLEGKTALIAHISSTKPHVNTATTLPKGAEPAFYIRGEDCEVHVTGYFMVNEDDEHETKQPNQIGGIQKLQFNELSNMAPNSFAPNPFSQSFSSLRSPHTKSDQIIQPPKLDLLKNQKQKSNDSGSFFEDHHDDAKIGAKRIKLDDAHDDRENLSNSDVENISDEDYESASQTVKAKIEDSDSSENEKLELDVQIEDLIRGRGRKMKKGDKVNIVYTGFVDAKLVLPKKSITFIIGAKDQVKGLSIGVEGMKRDGQRRITCPPKAAFGAKGIPSVIPAKSTVVFDVTLEDYE